jgi:hypothetical protein
MKMTAATAALHPTLACPTASSASMSPALCEEEVAVEG